MTILAAWVVTVPAAALLSAVVFLAIQAAGSFTPVFTGR